MISCEDLADCLLFGLRQARLAHWLSVDSLTKDRPSVAVFRRSDSFTMDGFLRFCENSAAASFSQDVLKRPRSNFDFENFWAI